MFNMDVLVKEDRPEIQRVILQPAGRFDNVRAHTLYIALCMERCRSGRTGRSRKPLYLMGTEGSNPSLSATLRSS